MINIVFLLISIFFYNPVALGQEELATPYIPVKSSSSSLIIPQASLPINIPTFSKSSFSAQASSTGKDDEESDSEEYIYGSSPLKPNYLTERMFAHLKPSSALRPSHFQIDKDTVPSLTLDGCTDEWPRQIATYFQPILDIYHARELNEVFQNFITTFSKFFPRYQKTPKALANRFERIYSDLNKKKDSPSVIWYLNHISSAFDEFEAE